MGAVKTAAPSLIKRAGISSKPVLLVIFKDDSSLYTKSSETVCSVKLYWLGFLFL